MKIIHLKQVDSTNIYAKALDCNMPCCVVADEQSAGRGRYDRRWVSQKNNLFCSISLPVSQLDPDSLSQLSFVTSVALAQSIGQQNVKLKWPNDVLLNDKKLSGILLETAGGNKISHLIIGVGVNIASHPEDVAFPATSLKNEGIKISRDEFLDNFLKCFKVQYSDWLENGFENIRLSWLKKCSHLDQTITVKMADKSINGIFKTISKTGELMIDVAGEEKTISSGDVFF